MTIEQEFIHRIQERLHNQVMVTVPATVESIQGNTCTVKTISDELVLDGVLLSAIKDNDKGLVLTPSKGSDVLIAAIGNDENSLHVVGYTAIDTVTTKIDNTVLKIDKNGYKISKDGKSLKDVLDGLIAVIMKIVVVQGTGPDIGKLKEIDEDIKALLI